jgi:rfaE bifunctional protein kinase chain/domain
MTQLSMSSKNMNISEIVFAIREKVKPDQKIVFISGNFIVVHPGHLRLLKFAKDYGDFLVVGVNSDRKSQVLVEEKFRLEGISAIEFVDYAFILDGEVSNFLSSLKPDFVIKGKEYEDKENLEKAVVVEYGGKILFGSGDIVFSSISMLRDELQRLEFNTIKKPIEFPKRHGFKVAGLNSIVNNIKKLKVCVIGDLIVDEYITCDPLGMSQEDPTIVVTPVLTQNFIGGAGIVASHAAGLGASVDFFSVTGKDKIVEFIRNNLEEYGVDFHLYTDESRPTTLKQRFRASSKTLLRVSHLRQHAIRKGIQENIMSDILRNISTYDLIIFSDFNYGCLAQPLVANLIIEAKRNNVMLVADSQCSSQIGDISRFQGMNLITPTEREARISVRDFESGLPVICEKLRERALCRHIIMTLGEEGILIYSNGEDASHGWMTDKLSAFNNMPKDTAGAGDSLLVGTSMGLALGFDIWQSSYFGSLLAACQVGRLGNRPLNKDEILDEIKFGEDL